MIKMMMMSRHCGVEGGKVGAKHRLTATWQVGGARPVADKKYDHHQMMIMTIIIIIIMIIIMNDDDDNEDEKKEDNRR